MSEKKDDINSELDEQFPRLVIDAVESLEILDNESIRAFLNEKKISNVPSLSLLQMVKELILLRTINVENFDRKLNNWMGRSSITFFSEIKYLMEISRKKNGEIFNQLLSKFLNLTAIKKIQKVPINLVQQGLMDNTTIDLEEKFREKPIIDYSELSNEINLKMKDIKERGKKLEKLMSNIEKKAHELLRLINNYIETSRYFIGLLIALLDLCHDRLEENLDNYFWIENSYLMLYKRKGYHHQKKIERCLKYYPINIEYPLSLKSVKTVFESFIFKEYKDLRIHNAHTDFDVEQNRLKEKIYIIKVNRKNKNYNMDKLTKLWQNYFNFFLNFKFLIAREYFNNDKERIRYRENRSKPLEYHIYPGKIILKED